MEKLISKIFILSLPLLLSSCGNRKENDVIYASCYPVYDLAKKVIGEKYEIKMLTPFGTEPHDYELSAKQLGSLLDSKALLINGLGLEGWYYDLFSSSTNRNDLNRLKKKTHLVSEGIEIRKIDNVEDPHVWLNPLNAIKEMENIYDVLSKIDEDNEPTYRLNYEKAKADFLLLDGKYKSEIALLSKKELLVSHAAFGYLCDAYGLKQIYVDGLSPDSEPSAKAIEKIMNAVDEYAITTIFYEEFVSSKIASRIAEDTGLKVDVLNPLETIDKDEYKDGVEYISVMENNLAKIKEALK